MAYGTNHVLKYWTQRKQQGMLFLPERNSHHCIHCQQLRVFRLLKMIGFHLFKWPSHAAALDHNCRGPPKVTIFCDPCLKLWLARTSKALNQATFSVWTTKFVPQWGSRKYKRPLLIVHKFLKCPTRPLVHSFIIFHFAERLMMVFERKTSH